ncbi:MAG: transporter substrate-binding domain-containing protein [Lachnospiraceae bacterium]|nr:transporter substrate-binding domain-containing protein [Lachnospiraceae bacterium]
MILLGIKKYSDKHNDELGILEDGLEKIEKQGNMADMRVKLPCMAILIAALAALSALCPVSFRAAETTGNSGTETVSTSEEHTVSPDTARYGINSVVTQDYINENYPNASTYLFNSAADSLLALESDKVDYVMTSRSTAGYMMKSDDSIMVADDSVADEACYIAVSKNNTDLIDKIDTVLAELKSDGTLSEMTGRWSLGGPDYYDIKEITPSDGTNGVLTVAVSPDVPPICFVQDGEVAGIDVELMEIIAAKLDMELKFTVMDFDAILPAVESGKADAAISDINATEERRELVGFTESYFDNPQVLLSLKSVVEDTRVPQYTELAQLSGKLIADTSGSIFSTYIDAVIPNVTYSVFNSPLEQIEALKGGRVEAVPMDEPNTKIELAKETDLTVLPQKIAAAKYGIVLQKGSPLTSKVNSALATLKADGTLDEMKERWMGSDDSVKVMPDIESSGANGTLLVAYDKAYEPMEYVDADGREKGYEVEMMLHIGKILGMNVEFTTMDTSGLIPMIQSGKADAAVGSFSITEERKEIVDMSDPEYEGGVYFIVRKVAATEEAGDTEEKTGLIDELTGSFTRTFINQDRWKQILYGLGVTVLISAFSGIFGSLLGFGLCMLRRERKKSGPAVTAFSRIIEGTPVVVLLMILYYIVFGKVGISAIIVAIIGFSINFGVYVSEMLNMGINAVEKGQIEAAAALGFTRSQVFRKVTFPQAAQHFMPIYKGTFVSMVKDTSVIGYIAIEDLTKVSDIIRSRTLEAFFPLIVTAVIYYLVANLLAFVLTKIGLRINPKREMRITDLTK